MARRKLLTARIWEVARGVLTYFETKLGLRTPALEQQAVHHIIGKMRINRRDDIDYVNSVVNRVQESRKAAKELNTRGRLERDRELPTDDRLPPNRRNVLSYEVAVTFTDPATGEQTKSVTVIHSSQYLSPAEIREQFERFSETTPLGPVPPGYSVPVLSSVEVIGVSGTLPPEAPF